MKRLKNTKRLLSLITVLALAASYWLGIPQARAASLSGSSVALSDARTSGTSVSYTIDFDNVTTSSVKCIRVEFDTLADGSGSKPTGMDITSAALGGTSDYIPTPGSWGVNNNNTTGVTEITYATGETPAGASDRTVVLTGITNGSTAETGYFINFDTFDNIDCATTPRDSGTGVFIFTTGQAVSLTVDPTISFGIAAVTTSELVNGATTTVATTDGTIPFSTVTDQANAIAAHDITTTTNAGTGYTASIRYTAVPSDGGSETIVDVSPGTNGSPQDFSAVGVEAFGYTTNDTTLSDTGDGVARFTTPADQWAAFTTSNAEVAYSAAAVSSQTIRVGYQVGVSGTTAAASYTTTVIITCTPQY